MPSPPSTRPSDARGRRSSAFVREDSGTATGPAGWFAPSTTDAFRRAERAGPEGGAGVGDRSGRSRQAGTGRFVAFRATFQKCDFGTSTFLIKREKFWGRLASIPDACANSHIRIL